MAKKDFSSGELMEAIRALDYKKKYEVLKASYLIMISGGFPGDDSMMCARFRESFSLIYPLLDENSFVPLHWAVNDMDNALRNARNAGTGSLYESVETQSCFMENRCWILINN